MERLLLGFLISIAFLTNINLHEAPKELDKNNISKVSAIIVNVDTENVIETYSFQNVDEFEKFDLTKALNQ